MSEILPLTEKANLPLAESGAGFNLKLTQGGTVLLAKALAGQQLEFKYVTLGSGVGSGNPEEATSLVNKVADLFIVNYKRLDTSVIVEAVLEYNSVPQGFTWTELGVIAIDPDTQEEVLYMYDYVQIGEVIPPAGAATQIEKQIRISTYVSNAANVTAEINESLINIPKSDIGQPNGVAPLNEDGVLDIQYGGTGAKTAQEALYNLGCMPRENLFINVDFRNPVNQRGQLTYTSGKCIDMCGLDTNNGSIEMSIKDDCIRLTQISTSGETTAQAMYVAAPTENFPLGQTITVSTLVRGTGMAQILLFGDTVIQGSFKSIQATNNWQLLTSTFKLPETISSNKILAYLYADKAGQNRYSEYMALKCELGKNQTLAWQDSDGNLHLYNKSDNAIELLKCQRYFVRFNYEVLQTIALATRGNTWNTWQLALPVPMRINPSYKFTCKPTFISDNSDVSTTQISISQNNIQFGGDNDGEAVTAEYIYAGQKGYIDISAEL